MSAEHERVCERTIASVVHEIDDLQHQLRDATAAVNRVRSVHYMIRFGRANPVRLKVCAHCETPWPCRTIKALETT